MPDITMCINGKGCPKHEECYRYMAKPDDVYQSYAMYYQKDKTCDSFWKISNEKEIR